MKPHLCVPIVMMLSAIASMAAEPPSGPNCDLTDPPKEAGEMFGSMPRTAIATRVYPRLTDIPNDYTGCQVQWIRINDWPTVRAVTQVRNGHVVAVVPIDGPLCKPGEKGADTGCLSRRGFLSPSYPAGCAARTLESGAIPQACQQALQAEYLLWDRLPD